MRLVCPRTSSIPGAAPRSRVVGSATTARTLYQRFLNLRVLWCTGVQALMVRQDVGWVVAGPVGVHRRAPLPAEFQAIVARQCGVVEGRLAPARNIGVYRQGIAIEEYLVTEIVGVESRAPSAIR